jgi:nucleoside-diphosphate-sugar epimerase
MSKVLMTGHNGYIGSVMAPLFAEAGHEVVGLDTEYFGSCSLVDDPVSIPAVHKDIRDLEATDLEGFDAVVHLAALSNDPIGNLSENWTEEINLDSSVRLAELARDAGVERLLFSSSCIMYGMSEDAVVDEDSPLDPKTVYARSKVDAERRISELATDAFSPVFLRNGTVYGLSPRMRFDTVFNDFMGSAVTRRKVVVFSDGKPWRPVVHVQDVSRAFLAVLEAPKGAIHDEAFNVGAEQLNHQVIQLAETAVGAVDGCELERRPSPGADQRTYRTDFSKFARTFPAFEFKWTPSSGAAELSEAFGRIGLDVDDFTDARFTRLRWLNHLLDSGTLDASLRWTNGSRA